MHDVIVLYNAPTDPQAFDAHYRSTHVPLVHAMPDVREFAWGKAVDSGADGYYLVARMTFGNAEEATAAMASPAGVAAVEDLANFAQAGVTVLNVARVDGTGDAN
jgi:uncharacterized protein (TIGR02118 family)